MSATTLIVNATASIIIIALNGVIPLKDSNSATYHYGWRINNPVNDSLLSGYHYDAKDFYEFEVDESGYKQFVEWLNNHVDSKAFTALNAQWSGDISFPAPIVMELAKAFNDHLRVASQAIYTSEHTDCFRIYLELSASLNFSGTDGALLLARQTA